MDKAIRGRPALHDGSSGDPTVISFDPGGVTGWALTSVHPDAVSRADVPITLNVLHYACGQFVGTEFDQVDQMVALCRKWPGAAITTEGFILLNNSSDPALLSPVRINAAFRYTLGRGRVAYEQMPAMAKTTMTDARLNDIGYLEQTRGKPHARDATRHNFTFWRRVKTQPALRRRVFPALS